MSKKRLASQIDELMIHCSATPNGKAFTAADIDQWHAQRGFQRDMTLWPHHRPDLKHIGYHYVIRVGGACEAGRFELETGAHCLGHNTRAIGVCLIGTDAFSLAQWATLKKLTDIIEARYPSTALRAGGIKLLGHRDVSPDLNGNGKVDSQEWIKTCPGFAVADWLAAEKRPLIAHLVGVPDPQPVTDIP
jgi:hypothetical protein